MTIIEPRGPGLATGIGAILILLHTTLLCFTLALLSYNLLPLGLSKLSRILSVLINFLAIVFTFTMGGLVLDDSTEVSESTCDVVYLVCTIFWPIVKSLVHIYFNEKLHFPRKRYNKTKKISYYIDPIFVLISSILTAYFLISSHEYKVEQGKCSIRFMSSFAIIYVLVSTISLNTYLPIAFYRLPPSSFEDMPQINSSVKYKWCSIVVNIIPMCYYVLLLLPIGVQKSIMLFVAAPVDMGITVVVLAMLECKEINAEKEKELERAKRQREGICGRCLALGQNGQGEELEFCTVPADLYDN